MANIFKKLFRKSYKYKGYVANFAYKGIGFTIKDKDELKSEACIYLYDRFGKGLWFPDMDDLEIGDNVEVIVKKVF